MENPGAPPKSGAPFFLEPRRARRAAVLWGLLLVGLTSWPSPPEVPLVSAIPNVDKAVHGLLYGIEGFLLYFAVAWPGPPRFGFPRALAIGGFLAAFGALDELHQAWIPGRMPEAADAVVDAVGGFLGAVAASRLSVRGRAAASRPPTPPDSSRLPPTTSPPP